MKSLTIIIIIVLIFGLIFYRSTTVHVVKIVGKHSLEFVQNVYHDLKSKEKKGEFSKVREDLERTIKKD